VALSLWTHPSERLLPNPGTFHCSSALSANLLILTYPERSLLFHDFPLRTRPSIHFLTTNCINRCIYLEAFIMRNIILLSIFYAVASAVPRPLPEQSSGQVARDIPNYPGIQFGANGQLSLTVFSDLHFGERELPLHSTLEWTNITQRRARKRTNGLLAS
jgi:hypothetical protein